MEIAPSVRLILPAVPCGCGCVAGGWVECEAREVRSAVSHAQLSPTLSCRLDRASTGRLAAVYP
eukprot:scaffold28368_cov63-Phaeocystis_antarctica.AAC.9